MKLGYFPKVVLLEIGRAQTVNLGLLPGLMYIIWVLEMSYGSQRHPMRPEAEFIFLIHRFFLFNKTSFPI